MSVHRIFQHDVVGLEVVVVHRRAVSVVQSDHHVSQDSSDERLIKKKRQWTVHESTVVKLFGH